MDRLSQISHYKGDKNKQMPCVASIQLGKTRFMAVPQDLLGHCLDRNKDNLIFNSPTQKKKQKNLSTFGFLQIGNQKVRPHKLCVGINQQYKIQ